MASGLQLASERVPEQQSAPTTSEPFDVAMWRKH
jgi:hypothetical protein